jgi:NAD(P)H-flavin reductase
MIATVRSLRSSTPTTRSVGLDLGDQDFVFAPGQAAFLRVPGAREAVPYSIACAPEDTARHRTLEFLIRLDGQRFGPHLANLNRGARVEVDGPHGRFTFPDKPEEKQFLFVAGGTGIAPLRSMIRHALAARVPGRLHLLYSARTPLDFAYLPELRGLARTQRIALSLTATREVPPRWRGGRGRITREQLAPLVEAPDTLCFVCGPAAMVDEVPRMLTDLGVARSRIRLEDW